MDRITVRPARRDELAYLQQRMAENPRNEQPALERGVVFVAERDGILIGLIAAHPMWRIEPLELFSEFKRSLEEPHSAKQRTTLMLIRAMTDWIEDPKRNLSRFCGYFCFITNRTMQKLAQHYGMSKIKTGGRFFGKEIF